MMNRILLVVVSMAAISAAGCIGFERNSANPTGPSASGVNALMGQWTSVNIIPSPTSCTDFKWAATEQTATSAKGSFSATCAGELKYNGTAEGTLSGSVITWKANGTANGPGITNCTITLNGTAELGVDSIRIPYTGDSCVGKLAGVETVRR